MRALVLVLLLGAIAAGADATPQPKEQKKKSTKSPRELFLARCGACHAPDRVAHRAASRDGWREIVNRMRRMPQSGISPADAAIILDYLAATPRAKKRKARGRSAYGAAWLSILEIATVRGDHVRLGGKVYEVERAGDTVVLFHGEEETPLALPVAKGRAKTLRVDQWTTGKVRYEVHLVLYEMTAKRIRLARALKKVS